jgi:hypothetical protein
MHGALGLVPSTGKQIKKTYNTVGEGGGQRSGFRGPEKWLAFGSILKASQHDLLVGCSE